MLDRFIKKILTRSALRVLLSVLVGLAVGLKMPEFAHFLCQVATMLQLSIEGCP